jgi:predicted DNA-binding transcriptional regulator AlpA
MQTAPPHRSIQRLATVRARVGNVHASTIYRWEAAGLFPRRVAFGGNMIGWYADEIDAWIESRQRADDSPARPSPNPRADRAIPAEAR